jgi:hypothetical protein
MSTFKVLENKKKCKNCLMILLDCTEEPEGSGLSHDLRMITTYLMIDVFSDL